MGIAEIRNRFEQIKGGYKKLQKKITEQKKELRLLQREIIRHEKALEIVKKVSLQTQQQLQYHISDITSLALAAVFSEPYSLNVEFVERRNKTECDLTFERNGFKLEPMDSSGLGTVDVASFALRLASWAMKTPHSRRTILLDEPFKHLRGAEENERVLQMVQLLSQKLGIQIIMIGDVKVPKEVLLDNSDRLFNVTIKNGVSKIVQE